MKTHQQIAEGSAQMIADGKYTLVDISTELVREVETCGGIRHTINKPVTLIIRQGGTTHRVVDESGTVHCYAAPETGNSIVRWQVKQGAPSVVA